MITEKKIAIVSDIHGNSWAFREVLKDIKSRGVDTIINLGDSLYGPLDPKGTFELLVNNNVISIMGNQDRAILENLHSQSNLITMEYVKNQIDEKVIDWLISLLFDFIYENKMYCCHASPNSDSTYLLEMLLPDHVAIKNTLEIDAILKAIQQDIVVCGHSHMPRIVETNSKIVINPGSVGLTAYDSDLPILHKMENYNSYAKYAILALSESLVIDQVAIPYNYEDAAKVAEKNKRNDWAKWIRTGRA